MLETILIGLILIQFQFQEDLHQKSKSYKTLLCNFPRRKFRILLQLLLPDLKAQRVIRKSNRIATKPVRRVRERAPYYFFLIIELFHFSLSLSDYFHRKNSCWQLFNSALVLFSHRVLSPLGEQARARHFMILSLFSYFRVS